MSWIPSPSKQKSRGIVGQPGTGKKGKPGVDSFGLGMERGSRGSPSKQLSESERSGRTQRRRGVRSGSKNTFRKI